ncbi:ABC transporter ATP-binding protein [Ferrovibrio sp.]|uniref:ABC transporter ATP-binding protein n=1 Tax=Ferrovibrio sp. TaxID=1917215 RepID=UPI0035B2CCF2
MSENNSTILPLLRLGRLLGVTRMRVALLMMLYVFGTVLEGFGIGMLLPIFEFMQSKGDLAALEARLPLWRYLAGGYGWLGLNVDFFILAATSLLFILLRQVCVYLRLYCNARYMEGALAHGRSLAFAHFLRVRLSYAERALVGNIVNDVTVELRTSVYNLFGLISIVGNCIVASGYFVLMLLLSTTMTLSGAACLGVAFLLLSRLMRRSRQIGIEVTQANQNMLAFLVERLRALRLVRLSGTEIAEHKTMQRLTGRQRDRIVKLQMIGARVNVLIDPIIVIIAFVFLYLGTSVLGLGLGEIGLFMVALVRMMPLVEDLLKNRQTLMGNLGSARAVLKRLEGLAQEAESDGGNRQAGPLCKGIDLRDVHFSYDGKAIPALRGVTLRIPAGQMLALVGPSGAGKSTLIDLLPRLRDPDQGQILFDGTDAREFDLASLRKQIAYAPQSPQIFDVTVAEHIRYGRSDASQADVVEAARMAGADAFIAALSEGYDTMLGETGVRLSGGQRQRLDLARALVSRASILILDEPTSNLDGEAEAIFKQTLERLRVSSGKTIIVVAHRLSTIAMADRIVVLRDGCVLEAGGHAQLMEAGGWYANALKQNEPVAGIAAGVGAR